LAIAEGIFTRAGAITNGCICDLGDIDCGEVPRAGQARQLSGVSAVGVDAIARFVGNQ
jgi:hypothetical protein